MIPFNDWIDSEASADAQNEIADQEQDPTAVGSNKHDLKYNIGSGGREMIYVFFAYASATQTETYKLQLW